MSSGFKCLNISTHDIYYDIPCYEGYKLIINCGANLNDRGECIFCMAKKISNPTVRYPKSLYS